MPKSFFAAAAAGVQVVSKEMLKAAPNLLAIADVNAVPPAGVEGMDLLWTARLSATRAS